MSETDALIAKLHAIQKSVMERLRYFMQYVGHDALDEGVQEAERIKATVSQLMKFQPREAELHPKLKALISKELHDEEFLVQVLGRFIAHHGEKGEALRIAALVKRAFEELQQDYERIAESE